MNKTKKILLLMLCAALLVGASVAGTVAYLTSTQTVKNTFTVGQVGIELHETNEKERPDGSVGLDLHLIPGKTVDKDPTVTVLKNSEACYVRMKVAVNEPTKLASAFEGLTYTGVHGNGLSYLTDEGVFNLHLIVDGWKEEDWAYTSYNNGVYEFRFVGELANNGVVPKNTDSNTVLPDLFTTITLPGAMTNTLIKNLEGVDIVVTAEAIQADTFADADTAWNAFGN